MAEVSNVCIGIQARSTSKRFPGKVFETIGGKTMLQHVVDACESSKQYLNYNTPRNRIIASVAVLVPYEDEIVSRGRSKTRIFEGSENDVLSRYVSMSDKLKADYIVRVTADCPLIPNFLITKHITTAVINRYDYCSNVDENARTAIDGFDVEVISRRALDWLDKNATEQSDREHVTTLLRRSVDVPTDFKFGHVVGYLNQSHMKLSVDTPEDLERVRTEYERVKLAIENAEKKSGKNNVHRF